jgi:hypothetical protein
MNAGQRQIHWTELPRSVFPNTSIGAIAILPNSSQPNYVQTAACLVSTEWGSSVLNATANTNTSTLVTVQSSDFETPWNDLQPWPQDRVQISPEWAQILAPHIAGQGRTITYIVYDAWQSVDMGFLERQFKSMREGCEAVIQASETHTRF